VERAEVEVITDSRGLEPLLEPWRRLAQGCGNAFVSPEWYLAALEWLHPGAEPFVGVVFSEGGVAGVLPLLKVGRGRRSPRVFTAGPHLADVFQPVTEAGRESHVVEALAPVLAKRLGGRCRVDLGRVDADAAWWRELAGAWSRPLTPVAQPVEVLPFASLTGLDWDSYLGTRSRQLRNQVRRKMRALQREHRVRLRRSSTEAEASSDLETLFRLHDARWGKRPDPSAIQAPETRRFHHEFALSAQRLGWLRLFLLEVDDEPVAAWYGWRLGDRYSYYQAGFDPGWSRYSVGFLMLAETVREAIAEGATEYDFLLGDEAFKARFATGERHGCRVLLAPRVSTARLGAVTQRAARSTLHSMPEATQGRLRALRRRLDR
jgi:CelD/BcsL family acetyltransferase involved in cellulose biosynthesis